LKLNTLLREGLGKQDLLQDFLDRHRSRGPLRLDTESTQDNYCRKQA
jgi:hypothetical protein